MEGLALPKWIFLFSILVACGNSPQTPNIDSLPGSPQAQAGSAAKTPSLSGRAGQLAEGHRFLSFMEQRQTGDEVWLNIALANFDGEAAQAEPWFVIWQQCAQLDLGELPNSGKCSGTQFRLSGGQTPSSGLTIYNGEARLTGRFRIKAWTGPNQGLMSCVLEAL